MIAVIATSVTAFAAIWLAASYLIAWASGWSRLASEFRAASNTTVPRIRLGTASMRFGAHYGHIVGLDCQTSGLSLSVLPLFHFCHPPLLIPWNQIEAEEFKSFFFFTATRLTLGREAQIPFTFYNREARELVVRYTRRS